MAYTLYHSKHARSVRVIWLMEELGIDYKLVHMQVGDALRSPQYLSLNPFGTIPTFVDGDTTLFEVGAIMQYVAAKASNHELMFGKSDPAFGEFLQWFHFGEATLSQMVATMVQHSFGPENVRVPDIMADTTFRFTDMVKVVGHTLIGRDFIAGNRFSLADMMIAYPISLARRLKLPVDYPHIIEDYLARLEERPACARAWAA